MKLSNDKYGGIIQLSRKEYQNLKNIFLDCAGWKHDDPPHIINLRTLTIEGNYKWHPSKSFKLRIEVRTKKRKPKNITVKGDLHIGHIEKPYISVPGNKI